MSLKQNDIFYEHQLENEASLREDILRVSDYSFYEEQIDKMISIFKKYSRRIKNG